MTRDEKRRNQLYWLIVFCLFYTVFNGSVRKWLIPGTALSNYLLAGQVFIPWLYYFLAPGSKKHFLPMLLGFSGILVLLAANPLNLSFFHGFFGIILHLGFFLMGFHYVENSRLYPWQRLQWVLVLIFTIEIVLSIFQYSAPRTHEINRYAAEGIRHVAYVGEAARVTGTFSYVSGYNAWLFFVSLWIWGLVLRQASSLWVFVLLGFTLFANIISGSRASLAVALVFTTFTVGYMLRISTSIKPYLAFLVIAIAGIWIYKTDVFVQDAWKNFYSRIEDGFTNKEYDRRTIGVIGEVIDFRGKYPLFGTGLGGTYQGARLIWGESHFVQEYGGYEEEPERIVIEGGFLLFLLRTGIMLYLFHFFRMPFFYKAFIAFYIIFFTHIVFNIYNIIFYALGLAFLDWCYRKRDFDYGQINLPAT